jgi:predicted PurR-regulated permease PerM
MSNQERQYSFPQKVWITGGIFAFIVVLILLLKATFSVLLLVLAGVLVAVFFRGLSGLIQRKSGWNEVLCLTISVLGTLILLVLLFWLIGYKIQAQASQLADTLPTTIEHAKERLNESPLGQKIIQRITSPEAQKKAQSTVQSFFRSTFGILGDVYVILFLGIFFTVSPRVYTTGMVKLVPSAGRPQAENLLEKLGTNLKKWLKGKILAMFVVAVLTATGLLVLGIPMWLALALIAGILNFIPNFGPLLAMIPAVLVSLMQGPSTALYVIGLYITVQVLESNFITPKVQQRLINIPPALIILAQLLIAPLTGGWGLVLATPLMVIIMVVVQELYTKKQDTRQKL